MHKVSRDYSCMVLQGEMQPNEEDMIVDCQALVADVISAAQFCLDNDFNKVEVLQDYKLLKGILSPYLRYQT